MKNNLYACYDVYNQALLLLLSKTDFSIIERFHREAMIKNYKLTFESQTLDNRRK